MELKRNHVYRLLRALYGLRQAGRAWNKEIHKFLVSLGFKQNKTEPCLYFGSMDGYLFLILVYVDDIIIACANDKLKKAMVEKLRVKYGVKDLGLLRFYLGLNVYQKSGCIMVNQKTYCERLLQHYGFSEMHPSRVPMEVNTHFGKRDNEHAAHESNETIDFPYREIIGSLMYLVTNTRPDLAYSVGQLSRYVECPSAEHVGALKKVLRYLAGTKSLGIRYKSPKSQKLIVGMHLTGFSDSDWAADPDSRQSLTGYVFTMCGGAISWASRKQTCVAQSSSEAEYVALGEAAMEGKSFFNTLSQVFAMDVGENMIDLHVDNQSSIMLATQPTYGRKTRHIELKWHYVRDLVQKKEIVLVKVPTEDNPADLLTKPLTRKRIDKLSALIGMCDVDQASSSP